MNKISKGKAVGLLSLGLASVALGSVGFASWVISTTSASGDSNVTVTVGAIQDASIEITAVLGENNAVVLDANSSRTAGPIKGSGSTDQDLTFTVDVTGKKGADSVATSHNCKFTVAMPGGLTADYVKVDSVTGTGATSIDEIAVPVSTGEGTKTTYTFTLAWGTNFKEKNPADLTKDEVTELGGVNAVIGDLRTVQEAFKSPNKITVTLSEVTPAP